MTKKEAQVIIGGNLTTTTKMPCKSIGIPAQECHVGKTLVEVEGSVCNGCYALKGMYRFTKVQKAQQKRFKRLYHKQWVPAMVALIGTDTFFRSETIFEGFSFPYQVISPVRALRNSSRSCFSCLVNFKGLTLELSHLLA